MAAGSIKYDGVFILLDLGIEPDDTVPFPVERPEGVPCRNSGEVGDSKCIPSRGKRSLDRSLLALECERDNSPRFGIDPYPDERPERIGSGNPLP